MRTYEKILVAAVVALPLIGGFIGCPLYTSDAPDDLPRVDLGGRRYLNNKTKIT